MDIVDSPSFNRDKSSSPKFDRT